MSLSKQKESTILKDLDRYMMGQLKLKDIPRLRKVKYADVVKLQNQSVHNQLYK